MKPPITSQARALAEIRSLSIRLEDSFPEAAQVLRTAAGAVGDGHVGQLAELARLYRERRILEIVEGPLAPATLLTPFPMAAGNPVHLN